MRQLFLILATFSFLTPAEKAQKSPAVLPPNLAEAIIVGADRALFSPSNIHIGDFRWEWEGVPLEGIQFVLQRSSLEWVRISEVMVLPRGRLRIEGNGVSSGYVSVAGFIQPFSMTGDNALAEVPVALISSLENKIYIQIERDKKVLSGLLSLHFAPVSKSQRIYLDPSCSRFNLSAKSSDVNQKDWLYIGCRYYSLPGDSHLTSNLQLLVYWEKAEKIMFGETEALPHQDSLWLFQLSSLSRKIVLRSNHGSVDLEHSIPEKVHLGQLGYGIGPYSYRFRGGGEDISSTLPVSTLYGSFYLGEGIRLVAFDILTIGRNFSSDLGVYLHFAYVRAFDRRLVLNLMLGANAIAFSAKGKFSFRPDLPQGVELVLVDVFRRSANLSLGGFLYPQINNTYYYNAWIRWGVPSLFVELNYISWQKIIDAETFQSTNVGLTVGFPLLGFL